MTSAAAPDKPTKAALIARRLTDEIVNGLLAPGTALDETSIAARYGVSRTPIREAIRLLSANGVVESRPHKGAVVRVLSDAQLDDVLFVMAELEGLCARSAATVMTGAEHRKLQAIAARSANCVASDDLDGYTMLNNELHEAIYAGAHNDYLERLTLDTRSRLAPYRQAQFAAPGRLARSFAEHAGVIDAIAGRDPARAYTAMKAHLELVRRTVGALTHPS